MRWARHRDRRRASGGPRAGLACAALLLGILGAAPPAAAQAQASPPAPPPPSAPPPPAAQPAGAAGTCDDACVRAFSDRAAQACAPRIEAQAPGDFDWLYRPFGNIFQQADTTDEQHRQVRYRGDSIRFQSPQKDWVRVTYECAFDPGTQRVVNVSVRLGRLDRPPQGAPGQASNPPPPGTTPGRKPVANAGSSATPPRKAPREASEIEFIQVNPQSRARTP